MSVSSKSPLLKIIKKAFELAKISKEPGAPSVDELQMQIRSVQEEYGRRRFLGDLSKVALYGGLAAMLPGCTKDDLLEAQSPSGLSSDRNPNQRLSIAIIGAGLAGLNCAYQLKKRGFDATIYEGSNRVGGRVFTRQNFIAPGTYTECGGEFIDTGHKNMRDLAGEFTTNVECFIGRS